MNSRFLWIFKRSIHTTRYTWGSTPPARFLGLSLYAAPRKTFLTHYRSYSDEKLSDKDHAVRENTNVGHARFLAEARKSDDWSNGVGNAQKGGIEGSGDELSDITKGRGKISPTSSHLFKLILPLNNHAESQKLLPTVFLLHPSQPLSHVARLIQANLPPGTEINFRSKDANSKEMQWADSTDIGDFIKSAARSSKFEIAISPDPEAPSKSTSITVTVPSFASRTYFLQMRLDRLTKQLQDMETIKNHCDREAHRAARRLAIGGFAILLTYWVLIARLTFWDYGWEVMEPVSYLSGLFTVIVGYLWFLHQGREVSYSSVLDRSVSARRAQLYRNHGFDVEHWSDLVGERKAVKKEIAKIAEDYGIELESSGRSIVAERDEDGSDDEQKGRQVAEEQERRS